VFSPEPLNAAVDAQWIYGTHWSTSLTRSNVRMSLKGICVLSVNEVAETLEGSKRSGQMSVMPDAALFVDRKMVGTGLF
jgi:hypothetical protein